MSDLILQGFGTYGTTVTGFPTGDQLQAFAMNAGIVIANSDLSLDYGRVMSAAIKQWQSDTGWNPFFASTQTRYYDLPRARFVDLRGGLLSLTQLTIGNEPTPDVLVLGTDFDLYPLNAPTDNMPYEWIEFRRKHDFSWNRHGAIAVTGSFGRVSSLPDEVAHAILCNACCRLAPTRANTATGMVTQIRQSEVHIQYATNVISKDGLTPQQMQLLDQYEIIKEDYRRIRII